MGLRSRLRGYYRRLQWDAATFWESRRKKMMLAVFQKWKGSFSGISAEVLLGGNFDASGGVRNHMHAINRYTKLSSELVPDEQSRQRCDYGLFIQYAADFLEMRPPKSTIAVHSHVSPWFIDWCAQYKGDKILWVHTHHLLYYDDQVGGIAPWQERLNTAGIFALRKCDVPLCVSPSQQRDLKRLFGVDAFYLPNGVDVEVCDRGNADRFIKRYKISKPFVLWVGRNEHVKNPSEFLAAAAQLPDIQFVMSGKDCSADKLQAVTGLEIPKNVLLTGCLERREVQDALAACRVLVVTSFREGLPTLILEAMCHGCTIVTSDADGCLDATDGDEFAIVYRRGDVDNLCDAVKLALLAGRRTVRARQRVLQKFDWKVVAGELDRIYGGVRP